MPAGTIALTNNSTAVTGTGTSFTTELKANDFVVAVVGGVAYTLGIKSVDSNTALTLAQAYTGPAASGLAWTPVPFGTMTAITAQLAAQVTYAVRGFNLDKANWQQVYSASGNITVTLPDGSQYSGPSWNSVAGSVTGKMDKSQNLNDVADKATARTNLGLKNSATRDVGTESGTVAAGDDLRVVGALQKSGGNLTGSIQHVSPQAYRTNAASARYNAFGNTYLDVDRWTQIDVGVGVTVYNQVVAVPGSYLGVTIGIGDNGFHTFRHDGKIVTNAGNVQISASDGRIKNKTGLPKGCGLERVIKLAQTAVQDYKWIKYQLDINNYRYEQPQRGFIAQDAYEVDPTYADRPQNGADTDMPASGENIWGLNTNAILADAVLAINKLNELLMQKDSQIAELRSRMKAIDGLDA